jgi:hypothetical protein
MDHFNDYVVVYEALEPIPGVIVFDPLAKEFPNPGQT